jgi:hypothetical protein
LVVLSQRHAKKLALGERELATPQRGLHADLFLVRTDGRDFWQLTRLGELGDAALDPRCAWDSDQVAFSRRTAARAGLYGHWEPTIALVNHGSGAGRFGKAHPVLPRSRALVVPLEFSADERSLLVSGNLDGQTESGLDLYLLPLGGGSPQRLTETPNQLDEYAHIAPGGRYLVWSTNRSLFPRSPPKTLAPHELRDLWIRDLTTGSEQRLTHFSGEGAPESLGEALVGDFSFHPDGRSLVVGVLARHGGGAASHLYRVELDLDPRRPGPAAADP